MLRLLYTLFCFLAFPMNSYGQSFPYKPIRLVVAYPAGGGADITARLFSSELRNILGQPIIVENRGGGGTNIANEFVANAPPDGYTLLVNSAAIVINSLYKTLNLDVLRDYVPISLLMQSPNVLTVHPSLPVRSVGDLVKLAKSKPGAMSFASGGNGTTQHLIGELFVLRTGTRMVHVPYKGGAPALVAVLGGHVELTFASLPAVSSYTKSGRLRAVATTATTRSPSLPSVPTLAESGVSGVDVMIWFGVFAPRGTPSDVAGHLSAAIRKAGRTQVVSQRLAAEGAEPVGESTGAFGEILKQELARWSEVIKISAVRPE